MGVFSRGLLSLAHVAAGIPQRLQCVHCGALLWSGLQRCAVAKALFIFAGFSGDWPAPQGGNHATDGIPKFTASGHLHYKQMLMAIQRLHEQGRFASHWFTKSGRVLLLAFQVGIF